MEELYQELKELIIDCLMLDDVKSSDISTDEPLFGSLLGLDSIDALELGLAVKRKYGVQLLPDYALMCRSFSSVHNIAAFIVAERTWRGHE